MTYGKKLLIAVDQLINTICGGWPDETLSSRAWRLKTEGKKSWPCELIDLIFFWEENHCYESYKSEIERKQYPPKFTTKK